MKSGAVDATTHATTHETYASQLGVRVGDGPPDAIKHQAADIFEAGAQ